VLDQVSIDYCEAASRHSTRRELIVDHMFRGELLRYLWSRGRFDFEIYESPVDASGFDLVIELGSVVRHIQLKAKSASGKTSRYNLHTKLINKPAACAIVVEIDEASCEMVSFRFFGDRNGGPIPDVGDAVARHTKGNAEGFKAERRELRTVPLKRFERIRSIQELAGALFPELHDGSAAYLSSQQTSYNQRP
jgi:hypothetical protein